LDQCWGVPIEGKTMINLRANALVFAVLVGWAELAMAYCPTAADIVFRPSPLVAGQAGEFTVTAYNATLGILSAQPLQPDGQVLHLLTGTATNFGSIPPVVQRIGTLAPLPAGTYQLVWDNHRNLIPGSCPLVQLPVVVQGGPLPAAVAAPITSPWGLLALVLALCATAWWGRGAMRQ
jgi:hypothetical protein